MKSCRKCSQKDIYIRELETKLGMSETIHGSCVVCDSWIKVKKDGTVRAHKLAKTKNECTGSHRLPAGSVPDPYFPYGRMAY